jgi:hypothetical protein
MNLTTESQHGGGRRFLAWEAVISVSPVGGGWCVSGPVEENLMFLTGGHAEDQARTLGRCLASLGQTAIIEVHDRKGAMAGSAIYLAEEHGGMS